MWLFFFWLFGHLGDFKENLLASSLFVTMCEKLSSLKWTKTTERHKYQIHFLWAGDMSISLSGPLPCNLYTMWAKHLHLVWGFLGWTP